MPSPFPGMDPYLENPDLWPDVHARLITILSEQLAPKLRPRYVARVELRTFAFGADDPAQELYVVPDLRIVESHGREARRDVSPLQGDAGGGGRAATIAEPIDITSLLTKRAQARYIEVRDAMSREVVTVIEVVSPSNKRTGAAARRAFIRKRDRVANSEASWLEIDLLRGGRPTWSAKTFPQSAYRAYVDRTWPGDQRRTLAWPIRLRATLPSISVPLRPGESDVALDLQAALSVAYDGAAYDLDIDYTRPPVPPLNPDDADWADELLKSRGLRR